MSYKIGLVGLPNVGKSTLFNILTKRNILVANYPFATIEPNIGVMPLADPCLENLEKYWNSQKLTPSIIKITDIAGLIKGASKGAGLGNKFLSHIREVDLICQVLRCFTNPDIIHVEETLDPIRDYESINLELIISDLQQIEKRLQKFNSKNSKEQQERQNLNYVKQQLEKERRVNQLDLLWENKKNYNFLTSKPVLCIANHDDENERNLNLKDFFQKQNLELIFLKVNSQNDMKTVTDNSFFLNLTIAIKKVLNLKVFYTVGKDEVKSWLIDKDSKARECAGLIHSDIQKKFICVEIYSYKDWIITKDIEELKKTGKIHKEKASYLIKEGDICKFIFGRN